MLSISESHSPHPVCNLMPASLLHLRESAGSMAVGHLQYSRQALPTSGSRSLERDKLSTRSPDITTMKTLHLCVLLVTTAHHICITSLLNPPPTLSPVSLLRSLHFLPHLSLLFPNSLVLPERSLNGSLGFSCLSLTLVTSGIKSNCLAL